MDKLLHQFHCDTEVHAKAIEHAKEKGVKLNNLNVFFQPESWDILTEMIETGQYHTNPPVIHYIDKDTGNPLTYDQAMSRNMVKVREIYVMDLADRIIWNAIYQILYRRFSYLIHPLNVSYKKKESTRTVAGKLSNELTNLIYTEGKYVAKKGDLSKYFDSVPITEIDKLINELESIEPSMLWNVVREFYHNDHVIINGELVERYGSLKQGCSLAALFANLILRDIDDEMTKFNVTYYRYSDDFIIVGKEYRQAFERFVHLLHQKGMKLNDAKTETHTNKDWFTFLGFRFKGKDVTISEKTLRNIRLKIKSETIDKCAQKHRALTPSELRKAIDNIQYYMFVGCKKCNSGMGSYLYGANVLEHDIARIDEYAKDCIRAAYTNKCEIYGLGCSYGKYGIVSYNRGKNVGHNRLIASEIPQAYGWYSLNHMRKKYLQGKEVYKAEILKMRNGITVDIY